MRGVVTGGGGGAGGLLRRDEVRRGQWVSCVGLVRIGLFRAQCSVAAEKVAVIGLLKAGVRQHVL